MGDGEGMATPSFTFAGVTTKLTSTGLIRLPALLKILRSGKVEVRVNGRYTDDYAFDSADKFGRGQIRDAAELAAKLERDAGGWRCDPNKDSTLSLACHSFLYLTIAPVAPTA